MSANGENAGARVAASPTPSHVLLLPGLPPGEAQAGIVRPLLGHQPTEEGNMTNSFIESARAIGAARRRTGREREAARRRALADLTRVARAALGIPADIALNRPGLNMSDELDQLELVAYGLVVEIAAVMTGEPDDHDARRRDLNSLLCDLIGLAASPALEETR